MNYHKITELDIANGPGIRVTLWVSGCNHHCKGCHNPHTWDPTSGQPYTSETLNHILRCLDHPHIRGLTISGGDPLYPDNRDEILKLVVTVKHLLPEKSIWLWTGYDYKDIEDLPLLKYIDVLVDGQFMLEDRDLTLKYKGSPNQRVIDVQASLEYNTIILYKE